MDVFAHTHSACRHAVGKVGVLGGRRLEGLTENDDVVMLRRSISVLLRLCFILS